MIKGIILFLLMLPFIVNAQSVSKPSFSHASGYYSDSIILSMNSPIIGADIRYTLNGDEPTLFSTLYTSPIVLKNRSHSSNGISTIPTNPSFSYPKPGYDSLRANTRGWLSPYDTVFKATIVKAKLVVSGVASDSTIVSTYLIKENSTIIFSMPVLSISLNSSSLFSLNSGIYVYGIDSIIGGNYSNDTSLRKSFIEFFEIGGQRVIAQYANIKIHGNGGRQAPQKSLQLIAEKGFGSGTFNHKFFNASGVKKFDRLLIRNGGHRPDCMPRDDISGEFLKSLNNISQNNRTCIVLINGEYWGIQTIKEIIDNNYFYRRYNIPKSDCVILTQTGTLDEGNPGDEIPYSDLLNFFSLNNVGLANNYNYVKTQMDIESFTDFQCAEIFIGNGDWPNNNTKFWRYKRNVNDNTINNHLDGKWRWILYDFDAGFGGDCSGIYPSHNALVRATDPIYNSYTKPLRSLLTNSDYKIYFINRFADLLNSNFLPNQLLKAINQTTTAYNPEISQHVNRWRYPSISTDLLSRSSEVPSLTKWNSIISGLINFSNQRPGKTLKQFINYFSLLDTIKVTLNVNDTLMGKIKINSLYIDQQLIRSTGSVYPWKGIYFNGNPVTLEALAYPGYKFLHWNLTSDTINPITKNITSDTLITAYFEADTAFKPLKYLYINEVMASNTNNIKDDFFENEDWIEIYNPNDFSVDLAGFYFSDNRAQKTKYKINTNNKQTIVKPHGFLLVWVDNDVSQGTLHSNFKLSAQLDSVFLTLPNGMTTVDSIGFKNLSPNISLGREMDGAENWILFNVPTPNSTNRLMELDEPDYFLIYPNPTSDILYLTQTKNITIYDLLSKKLLSLNQIKQLDFSSFAQGIYILKTDDGQVLKFVKN